MRKSGAVILKLEWNTPFLKKETYCRPPVLQLLSLVGQYLRFDITADTDNNVLVHTRLLQAWNMIRFVSFAGTSILSCR